MGTFQVKIRIAAYPNGKRSHPARELDAMVDTGATYSVLPGALLRRLGVRAKRKISVELANGREARWDEGVVTMRILNREIETPVLFGPAKAPALLGAISLEGAGFGVDPVKRKLIPLKAVALY